MSDKDEQLEAMSDGELQSAWDHIGTSSGNYDIDDLEEELRNRGYEKTSNDKYVEGDSEGAAIFGLGLIGVIAIAIILASIFAALSIVGMALHYGLQIMVLFLLTFIYMRRKLGRNKFANFLFFLGCYGLFSVLYPLLGAPLAMDGRSFEQFMADRTTMGELIKFTFYYLIFMGIAYLFYKGVVSYTRKINSTPFDNMNRGL